MSKRFIYRFPFSLKPTVAFSTMIKTIVLCIIFIPYITNSEPSAHLYLPEDDVEILKAPNFHLIENSTNAWLVEFYAEWCGYCQRFAPVWKEFASEVASWRDMIRVGVLDCSDEINTEICRKFKIEGYPTLRHFHENYQYGSDDVGVSLSLDYNVDNVKKIVIDRIKTEISEGRGKIYPNLLPYNYSVGSEVFKGVVDDVLFVFVVADVPTSYLGPELALDLHRTPNISVRYSPRINFENKHYPSLFVSERTNRTTFFKIHDKKDLKETVVKFLDGKGIKVVEIIPPKIQNSSNVNSTEDTKMILRQHVKKMGDVIFQTDLETALRYSLQQEVATVKLIKNEQLKALKSYLRILEKYFPFGYRNTSLMTDLTNLTLNSKEVEGARIEFLMKKAEKSSVFSSPKRFVGCLGRLSRYRRYPCSLWHLFHHLTIRSFETDDEESNPREVLNVVHDYVKYFFGCIECSQHFQKMASDRNMSEVSSLEESVLWLWESHNLVNKRLKGDTTEDPEYPKNQFPVKLNCPECYNEEGSWEKGAVLKYLQKMYGKYSVRYIGSDTEVLFPLM